MEPRADRAPVDREALERTLALFGESRTLPGEAYASADVFAWERERFFDRSWLVLGRAADLERTGDQRAVRAGTETVVLVRDGAGRLRGFFDVCRHRGHELLEAGEARSDRVMRCPYHGWVYELDGALRGAPGFHGEPGFDPAEHHLVPVRVAEWRGWLFADVSGEGPALEEHLGNLDELLAPYEPERLVAAARVHYDVAANWKVLTENYHECYHCSNIHPELCRVTPPDSGVAIHATGLWIGGIMDLAQGAETMSLTGRSEGVVLRGVTGERRRRVLYVALFPNLLISLHPDYVLTHRLEPVAHDRTIIRCEWLFPPEAMERNGFDAAYAVEFWDLVNRQDWRACESVQRGVSSRGFRPGPLSEREDEVYEFMAMVARGYLDGRITPPVQRATRLAPRGGSRSFTSR
jgi:Rieske 2Fe-2S family protein